MGQNNHGKIVRSALFVFGVCALVIYSMAITYCIYTHRYFETGLVLGATVLMITLILWAYKTT